MQAQQWLTGYIHYLACMARFLTRNILVMSFISFFTDVASEMLYPVMPVYLEQIGFSIILIGVLEGIAEATAGMSKGYFGRWSDQSGRRLPFVQWGYLLSAVSKPLLALFTFPAWVFGARTLDRLGKGIRTSARDALLSDETTAGQKGRVFGFHRALDTAGAAVGPLLALLYLRYHPQDYRTLFFIAFVPGMLTIGLGYFIRERSPVERPTASVRTGFFSYFGYWKIASPQYRSTVAALLLFTLFNSSDVFLLLVLKQKGFTDTDVLTAYIFYNLVYALLSYPAGVLGDRWGLKRNVITGMLLFAISYACIGFVQQHWQVYAVFLVYGAYSAFIEGSSKALFTNQSEKRDTATAIGFYSSLNSVLLMAASFIAGLLWQKFGPSATFVASAAGTATAAFLLYRSKA